jgi:peroxin-1
MEYIFVFSQSISLTVLHRLLRYQLGITPLFDYVRLQPVGFIDSSLCLAMVTNGSFSLSLQEVDFVHSPMDNKCPWRYPNASSRRGALRKSSERQKETGYLSRLRSILASWLDLSDVDRELPVGPGSLIALPWESAREGQTIYRLVAHSSTKTDSLPLDAESMCVLANDLPELLLKSTSALSNQTPPDCPEDQTFISVDEREYLLNLFPSTADVASDASIEVASTLTSNLECFDTMVLSGEVGSGKTHTALVLAARARLTNAYATLYLDCKKLQSSSEVRMYDILQSISQLFREANEARPCLVVLDDLDELIPNVNMGTDQDEGSAHQQQPNPLAADQAKLIADHLRNLMDDAFKRRPRPTQGNLFFILTCRDEHSIHPSILSERFYRGAEVPSFDSIDRERLFMSMLQKASGEELSLTHNVTLEGFGSTTEGFRPRDLEIVATRALYIVLQNGRSWSTCQSTNVTKAVQDAMLGYVPISRQGIRSEDTRSSVTWSQVGGLFRVKKHLASTILHPVKYRRIYELAPTRLPRGILLFGPPGCGKSFLVPALAKECGLTLITCRGPELLDKYIGASEANVRQLFQRAFAAAPCLLFLDEFDALAPVRGSDHTGVTDRVVNQLLTYLDGVEDTTAGSIYVVAATSRPDKVDPALLRPGRLEQHVFVGFPSSQEEWHSVLEQILLRRDIDSQVQECLSNQTLWEIKGATQMHSFSPADLKAVADTAYLNAVHEYLVGCDTDEEQDVTITIQMSHVVKALLSTRPSLSVDDRKTLNRIYRPYVSEADQIDDDSGPTNEPTRLRTALK